MSRHLLKHSAEPQPAAATGRMAAGDRRRQIVDVAMRLFSDRGFRGTTTKEIAQAAGVSEAIIFRHFATKEDLYTAIIDQKACAGGMADMERPVVEDIQCSVAAHMEAGNDRAVFEHIALHMMEHHARDTEFLRLLFYSALEGHQLSEMFWDRNVRALYEFLGSYIRRRQREGALRDFDPRVAVRAFAGMIIHHSVNNILWDRSRALLDIKNEDAARAFTDILLHGISAGEAAERQRPAKAVGARSAAARRAEPTRGRRTK
jgi:TetR/AcrR family transcriptional regulator